MSPGLCKTAMTVKVHDNPNAYSSESGAFRIYQSATEKGLSADIFYHRGRESNYLLCGDGLPLDSEFSNKI